MVRNGAAPLGDLWRADLLESSHSGHVVICDAKGIVEAWGDSDALIYPRSSCKMIQALPLVESGTADALGLTPAQLALACASHEGAALHVGLTGAWLQGLGLREADLRCGAHEPSDRDERRRLIREDESPCQLHNNCSGKHCGFLSMVHHHGWDAEYTEIDHPLQRAIAQASQEVSGETIRHWGVDGCSAPNFAMSVKGLAGAMAKFAVARAGADSRQSAMARLVEAMAQYPELVAGKGRACTELMAAMGGRVAIKTGAEGVFVAILPEQGLGIALKVVDGNPRASEAVIAALLVRLGVLDAAHPAAQKRMNPVLKNWRGLETGRFRVADSFR